MRIGNEGSESQLTNNRVVNPNFSTMVQTAHRKTLAGFLVGVAGTCLLFALQQHFNRTTPHQKEVSWNDGVRDRRGSCFCGDDAYCLCTPSLSVDVVIELHDGSGVCLVQRADNAKLGNCFF